MKKYNQDQRYLHDNQDGFDMEEANWGETRRKGCGQASCGGNFRQERERSVWNERLIIDKPNCNHNQTNGCQSCAADNTCGGCNRSYNRDDGGWQETRRTETYGQRSQGGAGQWNECGNDCNRDNDDELTWDVRYRRHGGHEMPAHTHYFEGYTTEQCGHRHYVRGMTERECMDD